MQKASPLQAKWRNAVFFLIALLVVVADQLSKVWIRSNLAVGESLPETGLLRLIHIRNTGAAFGLFQGQSFSLIITALIGIIVILLLVLFFSHGFPLLEKGLGKPALGLVLGGTVGNLIDRLRFVFDSTAGNLVDRLKLGYVTDFINIGVWPAFNIADSAITVGVILFACFLLFSIGAKKY